MARYKGLVLVAALLLPGAQARAADPLPADADRLVRQFEQDAARLREKTEIEVQAQKARLLVALQALQDTYTRAGKLDEAVAIRDQIRCLQGVAAAPAFAPVVARAPIEVEWGGRWWAAVVLQVRGGLTLIHYTGWASCWDEWVPPGRIRPACAPPIPYRR
jgi:hypothetical protein